MLETKIYVMINCPPSLYICTVVSACLDQQSQTIFCIQHQTRHVKFKCKPKHGFLHMRSSTLNNIYRAQDSLTSFSPAASWS